MTTLGSARVLHPSGSRGSRLALYIGDEENNRNLVSRVSGDKHAVRFLVANSVSVALQIAAERQLCLIMIEANLTDHDPALIVASLRQGPMPVPKPIVVLANEGTSEERARFIWAGASTYVSDITGPEMVDRAVGLLLNGISWR